MVASHFFGLSINPNSLVCQSLLMVLAMVIGGLIGLQRELSGQAAGLRTHALVCLGSALVTLASVGLSSGLAVVAGSPDRIPAQIVTGIGFLGGGAILREGLSVRGLTTAASIWVTAGIGIALGLGPRIAEIGVVGGALALITLSTLNVLETALKLKQPYVNVDFELIDSSGVTQTLLDLLQEQKLQVLGLRAEGGKAPSETGMLSTRAVHVRARLPGGFDRVVFNRALSANHDIVSFFLE